jgi:hypothetical protein
MGNNKHAKITLITIAVISLFTATIMIAPPQQVYSLSIYEPDAASPSPNDVTKPATTTTSPLPSIPPAECAMDTIESLQTFLSCLGAK